MIKAWAIDRSSRKCMDTIVYREYPGVSQPPLIFCSLHRRRAYGRMPRARVSHQSVTVRLSITDSDANRNPSQTPSQALRRMLASYFSFPSPSVFMMGTSTRVERWCPSRSVRCASQQALRAACDIAIGGIDDIGGIHLHVHV